MGTPLHWELTRNHKIYAPNPNSQTNYYVKIAIRSQIMQETEKLLINRI